MLPRSFDIAVKALAILFTMIAASTGEAQRVDTFGDPLPPGAVRRIGSIHFRHGGNIRSLVPCPDGKTLVSADYFGSRKACLWELATDRLLHRFPTSIDSSQIAVSPSGTILATIDGETVCLWELASGRELHRLKAHRYMVRGLAFSPDGKMLASSDTESVRLWDPATGSEIARLPWKRRNIGYSLLAFTPDNKTLLVAETSDVKIHLWDVASRRERGQHELTRDAGIRNWSMVLSPDCKVLATGCVKAQSEKNGLISLWDMTTGKLIREVSSKRKLVHVYAFSPDGKFLAGTEFDPPASGDFCVWAVATGERRFCREGYGDAFAFSRDSKSLFVGSNAIRRLDAATGREIKPPSGKIYGVYALALSPNGQLLASSDTLAIELRETATDKLLRHLGQAGETLAACAFSPDGKTLAVVSFRGALRLWDTASGKEVRVIWPPTERKPAYAWQKGERLTAVAFSPDGQTLATSSLEGTVCLWNARTGERLHRFSRQLTDIESVAFSADSQRVYAATRTRQGTDVRVWEIARGEELPQLTVTINAQMLKINTGRFNYSPRARLALSRDGRMLALNREKTISVWETATGKERLRLKGHAEPTLCLAFSPDGRLLASSASDSTLKLWDLATGAELAQLSGHRGQVRALVFSPDGKLLYSGGDDTSILVSDMARITKGGLPAVPRLDAQSAWDDLAADDAAKGYGAIHALRTDAAIALPLFGKHLRPAQAVDAKHLDELIRGLDADEFAVRDKAVRELEKWGESAESALRRALRGTPALEVRRRIDQLLEKLVCPTGDTLRQVRAVEVLEHIASPEARQLLHKLADGAPEARQTHEAKAALERITHRLAVAP
jgi:WD40 repeat protein